MINIFNVERHLHIPNGDVIKQSGAVSLYEQKETDKLVLEYKMPHGNPVKLIFTEEQEQQLRDYLDKTERL